MSLRSVFSVVVYLSAATLSAYLIVDIPDETTKHIIIKSNYPAEMGLIILPIFFCHVFPGKDKLILFGIKLISNRLCEQ